MGVIRFLDHYFDDLSIAECVVALDRFGYFLEKDEYRHLAKDLVSKLDIEELIQMLEICLEKELLSEKVRSFVLKEIYVRTIPSVKIVKGDRESTRTGTNDLQEGKVYTKKRGKRK